MSKIADRHLKYQEIRNEELSRLTDEICFLCQHYGVTDMEFDSVSDMCKSFLYTYVDIVDTDDEDLEET